VELTTSRTTVKRSVETTMHGNRPHQML